MPMHRSRRPLPRSMLLSALAALAVAVAPTVVSPTLSDHAAADNTASLAARGAILFTTEFTPEQGLGPLFNRTSCVGCHAGPGVGGMGPEGLGTATRVGRLTPDGFDPLIASGGPGARPPPSARARPPRR